MTAGNLRVLIDPNGRVTIYSDGRIWRAGWVDKYAPLSSRAPWRGVREGGHEKRGFRTRAEAAEWVVGA